MRYSLSEKEQYLLWTIACWFDTPVTQTLKQKLYIRPDNIPEDKLREYDRYIEDRTIEMGKFLEGYRNRKEVIDAAPSTDGSRTKCYQRIAGNK